MATINGNGLVLVEQREGFRLDAGSVFSYVYHGREAELRLALNSCIASGYEAELVNRSGVQELIITTPSTEDPALSPDTIVDEWDITTQFTEIDYWSDPGLRKYLIGTVGISSGSVDSWISVFRWNVEEFINSFYDSSGVKDDKLKGPTPYPNFAPKLADSTTALAGPTYTDERAFLNVAYQQILMGMTKSRVPSVSITRRRTLKTSSVSRFDMKASRYAWQPTQFYSTFSVPSDYQAKLPTVPSSDETPTGTTWAWALTAQNFSTSQIATRGVERLEFVFGACRDSTFTYNP